MCIGKEYDGLGFRDLECFNQALLAKQAWRMLHSPNSFPCRIFKAKYFPHSPITFVVLGSRPSFIWRNFWQATHLLKEVLIWRVGDGTKIHVWKDKWLPRASSYKVQSPVNTLSEDALVAELINASEGWWKQDLIQSVFHQEDISHILNIPVNPTGFSVALQMDTSRQKCIPLVYANPNKQ